MALHLKYCQHKIYFTGRVFKLFLDLQTSFSTGSRPTHNNLEPTVQPIATPFFLCTMRFLQLLQEENKRIHNPTTYTQLL